MLCKSAIRCLAFISVAAMLIKVELKKAYLSRVYLKTTFMHQSQGGLLNGHNLLTKP